MQTSLLLAILLAAADPLPPLGPHNRDYDQVHLQIRVAPRIEEGVVDGSATIRFASLADPLQVLRLHCEDTEVLGVKNGEGRDLRFTCVDGILAATLAAPLARDAAGSVTVAYRARPRQGMFFHRPTAAAPSVPLSLYTQGEGTDNRRWFPCYDEPDDRATVEVFATVPAALKTVGNGTLVASTPRDGGLREDHWRLEQRVPSYLVSLIAGPYESSSKDWKGIPLELHAPPGRLAELENGCDGTAAMMAFFTDWLAAPYPYPRYAQTTVWDFVYGGMENASATTMNMRLLHGKEARPNYTGDVLVAHELAHQWFGDLITCRTWDHLWLNEGFATYFTDLFFEHRDGAEEFALHRRSQNLRYMEGTAAPERLGLERSPRGDVPLELFGGKQYNRGAAILHQLRLELGDAAFQAGIRRYVKERADSAVTSEEFRKSMEAATGRDLGWFFRQWVYGAGYPVLEVSVERDEMGARITVEQVQKEGGGQPEAFRLLVPVSVHIEGRHADGVLDVRRLRQTFWVAGPEARPGFSSGPPDSFVRVGTGGGVFARIRLKQSMHEWEAALTGDHDATGRLDAVEALQEWPEHAVLALPPVAVTDKCWAVRQAAVRALGGLPSPLAVAPLVMAASDADGRVREAAVEALGGRSRDEVEATLRKVIAEDTNPHVKGQAARSLGRIHATGAFETLAGLLKVDSHREAVRMGALDGLRELGDRRALDLARPLLAYEWPRGDHLGMREAALNVLLGIDPDAPATRAAVVALLADPHHRMRSIACGKAGDFAVREAEGALRILAEKDPFEGIREAAKRALEKVAPPRK